MTAEKQIFTTRFSYITVYDEVIMKVTIYFWNNKSRNRYFMKIQPITGYTLIIPSYYITQIISTLISQSRSP